MHPIDLHMIRPLDEGCAWFDSSWFNILLNVGKVLLSFQYTHKDKDAEIV